MVALRYGAEVVLGLEGGQAEVNRAQGAQHEPLDAVEVVQAEGQCRGSGLGQSFAWVVEIEPVKPAQSTRPVTRLHQCAQLRDGITGATKYELLGQERRRCAGLASGCSVLGIGYARSLAILDATVFGYLVFAIEEDDVKSLLRSGAPDEDIAALVRRNVAGKWLGHEINSAKFVAPPRPMYSIGG